LPFGQELSLTETPETPGYQPFALHRDQAQCKEEDESLNSKDRQIQDLLPEVKKYQLFQAKKHLISCGRG